MNKSKIINKIEKLLALATSPNKFEAALAMEKAAEILKKHNLSMADIGKTEEASKVFAEVKQAPKRFAAWKKLIYATVPDVFDCSMVLSRNRETNNTHMVFVGQIDDLKLAVHFCDFFINAVEKESKQFRDNTKRRNDFKYGMTVTVVERVRKMREIVIDDKTTALVVIGKKKKVNEFVYTLGKIREEEYKPRTNMSRESYFAGVYAGNNINLHPPIEHQQKNAIQ